MRTGPDRLGLAGLLGLDDDASGALEVRSLSRLPPPRERLQALVRFALDRPVQIETAWLSWRAVRVLDVHAPGRLELGSRHGLVGPALHDDASVGALWPAALVVVADVVARAPSFGPLDRAACRIIATARRHADGSA